MQNSNGQNQLDKTQPEVKKRIQANNEWVYFESITGRPRYTIRWSSIKTPSAVVNEMYYLAKQSWITPAMLADFVYMALKRLKIFG